MSVFSKSIVAAGHQLVCEAAASVLKGGGNAFDAIVAGGFAGAVVEPCLTSLGGGGFLVAKTGSNGSREEEICFDFFVDTPGKGLDNIPEPHFFPVNVAFGGSDQEFNIGLGSVAVPGTLKGLLHVHDRLGYMDLVDVLSPALGFAKGHIVNEFQGVFMKLLYPIMTMSGMGKSLYEPEGVFLGIGDHFVNHQLADFLEHLPADKGDCFYKGEIATKIAQDMKNGNGLLTREDLAGYRVAEKSPLETMYRGQRLLTTPPPSLGGSLVALSLGLLEKSGASYDLDSAEFVLHKNSIMQEVERLREQGVVTPDDVENFFDSSELKNSLGTIRLFSRGTTHISIADKDGNVASMTCSNGEGSGYFAPETGIMLNNMMGEDDLHPDGFHSSPPGQRVGSMMAPSILIGPDNEVKLVIGSGGSKRIRTAISQVLSRVVDYKQNLQSAVDAPRLYWDGELLQMESGFDEKVVDVVSQHGPVNCWQEKSVYFGGVHAVIPGQKGAGDPRRGGASIVVSE